MKVIIMRGLPGSGKSFFAKNLGGENVIVSADDYFLHNGRYEFVPSKLGEAHAFCMRSFIDAIHNNVVDNVIVDNTNIRQWEIHPYYLVAQAYGLPVEIVTVNCNAEKAFGRNQHGVPLAAIQRMAVALANEVLPRMYVNRTVSEEG